VGAEVYEYARRQNASPPDESSVLMVLCRVWGVRGGAMAVVSDDVFEMVDEAGSFDAETTFDVGAAQMERLARVGSETVRVLAEGDAAGPASDRNG
jgi:uridine phosphorylase